MRGIESRKHHGVSWCFMVFLSAPYSPVRRLQAGAVPQQHVHARGVASVRGMVQRRAALELHRVHGRTMREQHLWAAQHAKEGAVSLHPIEMPPIEMPVVAPRAGVCVHPRSATTPGWGWWRMSVGYSHSIKETVHYPPTFVCPQSPELRIGAGRANAAELDCCCRRR